MYPIVRDFRVAILGELMTQRVGEFFGTDVTVIPNIQLHRALL